VTLCFDRLVRAGGFVCAPRRQNELTVRNRIPVWCACGSPRRDRRSGSRARQRPAVGFKPFPEGAHLLARQHGEQIDALVCSPRTARGTSSGSCLCRRPRTPAARPGRPCSLARSPTACRTIPPAARRRAQPHAVADRRLDDLGRAVGRAVVHDDHFDRRVRGGEYGPHAALDVAGLVPGGDDDGDERAGCERLVVAQPGP